MNPSPLASTAVFTLHLSAVSLYLMIDHKPPRTALT